MKFRLRRINDEVRIWVHFRIESKSARNARKFVWFVTTQKFINKFRWRILRGWQKARLIDAVDSVDEIIDTPDYEEGMLLQNAMVEMILEDESENQNDEVELLAESLVEEIELIPEEPERNVTTKQNQITDFFAKQK